MVNKDFGKTLANSFMKEEKRPATEMKAKKNCISRLKGASGILCLAWNLSKNPTIHIKIARTFPWDELEKVVS